MKATYILGSIIFTTGLAVGALISEVSREEPEPETIVEVQEKVVTERVEIPGQAKVVEVVKEIPRQTETLLNLAEKELIASVVYAEAGNQDMIGKRLVVDTILNRKDNEQFPNTISGVIRQKGQYHKSAYLWDEACMQAVEMETYERLDYDIYWFNNDGYLPYGQPAYQHGDHYFSWEEL